MYHRPKLHLSYQEEGDRQGGREAGVGAGERDRQTDTVRMDINKRGSKEHLGLTVSFKGISLEP